MKKIFYFITTMFVLLYTYSLSAQTTNNADKAKKSEVKNTVNTAVNTVNTVNTTIQDLVSNPKKAMFGLVDSLCVLTGNELGELAKKGIEQAKEKAKTPFGMPLPLKPIITSLLNSALPPPIESILNSMVDGIIKITKSNFDVNVTAVQMKGKDYMIKEYFKIQTKYLVDTISTTLGDMAEKSTLDGEKVKQTVKAAVDNSLM